AQSAGALPGGFNTSVYLILGTFLGVLTLVLGGIWKAVQSTPVTPRDPNQTPGFPIKLTISQSAEVSQHLQAHLLRFFGVELRAHDVVAPDAGDEWAAVVGGGGDQRLVVG